MASQDHDFLEQMCDPHIYASLHSSLASYKQQGCKIAMLNPSSPTECRFVDAVYKHSQPGFESLKPDGDNQQMQGFKRKLGTGPLIDEESVVFEARGTHVDAISVGVVFKTAKKLVVVDESGVVVRGDASGKEEEHIVRMDAVRNYSRPFALAKQLIFVAMMIQGRVGFEKMQWAITDIDNFEKNKN